MENKLSLKDFQEKYKICDYCMQFNKDPSSVSKELIPSIKQNNDLANQNQNLNNSPLSNISDFIKDSVCLQCTGIWKLFHLEDFYEYYLRVLAASGYQYEDIQTCIRLPISLKLR